MSTLVRLERDGEIAVIVIDNPPVNAGSLGVRQGLLVCIGQAAADPAILGMILIGAGKTFIAGSDLKEFGAPLADPQLPTIIAAIEDCAKPVVAALHGAAFGGGFELALGCDARVASAGTLVGLPEVTLGMIPGAGGTQRLPRLIGIAKAIELTCAGTRVEARQALELGLIDALAEGDLRASAIAQVRAMDGRKRRLRDLAPPADDADAIERAAQAALIAGRHRPPVQAAIVALRACASTPISQALQDERAAFQIFRMGGEAFALRHLFFAEKESLKLSEFEGCAARAVHGIAVIGAGTMGVGIALTALTAGFTVALLESDSSALASGLARLRDYFAQAVAGGTLTATAAAQQQSRLRAGTESALLDGVQLVIEAVVEELAVKRAVLHRVDALLPPGVILASNTSGLDLDAIAEATGRPQDVVGMHFFKPVDRMRLLEVVRGTYTAPEVLSTCFSVARRLGKLPLLCANVPGFIGQRIAAASRRQCEFMRDQGATPQQIDQALQAFGFASGQFTVIDSAGCEPVARDSNLMRRQFSPLEIQRRVLLAMANEAALLLAEGVSSRVGDIDLALVHGFGFPAWQGGPVFWACRQDLLALEQEQKQFLVGPVQGALGDIGLLRRLLPPDRLPPAMAVALVH